MLQTRLAGVLSREHNNYDLLRLILATMVIWSHSFAIQPAIPRPDPLADYMLYGDSGSLAVTVFFVLSGLFVTDSMRVKRSVLDYLIMRTCRIFPGLLVCLVLTVLVVGPIFTTLPLAAYFRNPASLSYITTNLALTNLQWRLPGVFADHAYGLNGSMWTLPTEVRLYLTLALLHLTGAMTRRWTAVLAIGVSLALFLRFGHPPDPGVFRLAEAFSAGALLAVLKPFVPLSPIIAGALGLIAWGLAGTQFVAVPFYAAAAYTLLWAFSLPLMRRIRVFGDLSYGVYIYGFTVEQVFAHIFPAAAPPTNAAISALVCWGLGALSWMLIERPALSFGRRLPPLITSRIAATARPTAISADRP